jgi:dolichyl-phosphate-mannose-protein mannosyltransferase
MPSIDRLRSAMTSRASVTSIAVLVCLLGAAVRLALAMHYPETPLIDENEVVEQAVAFMGGDLHHHFLKYGPLTMYVLAAIYRGVAAVHGESALDYASHVFFDGAEHYLIARGLAAGSLVLAAWLAFASFRRHFGASPALLVCCLLGLPIVDALYDGVRIDVIQAVFQSAALLALTETPSSPRKRYWIIAGACAGFAFAAKPLPGLLVLPCFGLASWFAVARRSDGSPRPWLRRLGAALTYPGLWLAALVCLACAILGDPAVLDYRSFIQNQEAAVALHSSAEEVQNRLTVLQSFAPLGLPFLIVSGLAVLVALIRRDPRALIVSSFVGVYAAAFWGRGSRTYFMVAPAMAACLVIGYAFAGVYARDAGARWRHWLAWSWLPLVALLVFFPARRLWGRQQQESPALLARAWFQANVPSGTPVMHLGRWMNGPLIIGTDEKIQARWGNHFEYGRYKYKFLKLAFHKAFTDYLASDRPRYPTAVEFSGGWVFPRKKMPRRISDGLLRRAQAEHRRYIVVAGYKPKDVRELGYPWFDKAVLEVQFRRVAIFRVPETAPSADTLPASVGPPPL